jgi:hypothetical protein
MSTAPYDLRRRRVLRGLSAAVLTLVLAAALSGAYQLGRATAESVSPATGPWLDAEYDYLGALRTWPARTGSRTSDPFRGVAEARLVAAGRTVCIRATDPGMNADGMLDLLELDPHQTYVVVTESLDKLCPSQSSHLAALTTGG